MKHHVHSDEKQWIGMHDQSLVENSQSCEVNRDGIISVYFSFRHQRIPRVYRNRFILESSIFLTTILYSLCISVICLEIGFHVIMHL